MQGRKTLNIIITIVVVIIGGILGFKSSNQTNISAENTPVIPKFIDVPRTTTTCIIDLQKDLIKVSNNANNSSIFVTKTSNHVLAKQPKPIEVVKYVRVDDVFQRSRTFNTFFPIEKEVPVKITLARN